MNDDGKNANEDGKMLIQVKFKIISKLVER
jgi:hypothetical protein